MSTGDRIDVSRELTSELDSAVGGGSRLHRTLVRGFIAGAQGGAGVQPAFINTNAFYSDWD